jgi:hypothetical protein
LWYLNENICNVLDYLEYIYILLASNVARNGNY